MGNTTPISSTSWPTYDETKTVDDEIEIPIQVNGKVRGKIEVDIDITKEQYSFEDYQRCILPKIKEEKNLFLSGRMPLWLLASISNSYDSNKIFTFQPGKGFTCIASVNEKELGKIVDGADGLNINQYFEDKKEKHTNKPEMGHFKKAGVTPKRHLAEFKGFETEYKLGDVISIDLFAEDDFVDVVGTSKGKGYQGVVKRHGFGGVGQTTHGQHNRLRAPGSIGACSYPARVFKGTRMAGQTGNERVTVQNLQVLKVIPEHNLLMIKGSVPGCKGSIVIIEK